MQQILTRVPAVCQTLLLKTEDSSVSKTVTAAVLIELTFLADETQKI